MINCATLNSVINILKENHIVCGIGGSYLLNIYQLYDKPEDIDFWVAPEDIEKVRYIFRTYEEIQEKIYLPSKYRFKMRYEDIEVDFVACFIVKPNKNEYVYNIMPKNIEIVDTDDGRKLPCTLLEDWYIVYRLLRKEEKANLIKKYILVESDTNKTNKRFKMFLNNTENRLPKRIIKDVKELTWENIQFTLEDLFM